ncbi:transcription factor Ouib-like [Drosophila subpulchrella]|uniref:transcription factor Ouib-like n=1 Tax=Drosophila subpulchrella TaxID=1486046 RepID=UPI0018A16DF5|nr:transcription factor Ouib-like [Drosophila subpulchrella]
MTTLCRTCGQEAGHSKALFEEDDSRILCNIHKLTGIRLTDSPGVPERICLSCVLDLKEAIAFRERCIKTITSWFNSHDKPEDLDTDAVDEKNITQIKPRLVVPINTPTIHRLPTNRLTIKTVPMPIKMVPTNRMPISTAPSNKVPFNIVPTNTMPINTVPMPINMLPVNIVPINIVPVNIVPIGKPYKIIEPVKIPPQRSKKVDKIPVQTIDDLTYPEASSADLVDPLRCEDTIYVKNEPLLSDEEPEESRNLEVTLEEEIKLEVKTKESTIEPLRRRFPYSARRKKNKPTKIREETTNDSLEKKSIKEYNEKKSSKETVEKESLPYHINNKLEDLLLAEDSVKASSGRRKKSEAEKAATRRKYSAAKRAFALEHRLFFCDQCGKTFAENGNFKVHLKTHTGTKDFQCKECDRKELTQHMLNLHVRIKHRGELPYVCKYCAQRFDNCLKRLNHERNHKEYPNQKPHVCHICKKGFKKKGCLKNHSVVHTGEQPFYCEVCQTYFNRRNALSTHRKSKIHRLKAEKQAENPDDQETTELEND